MASPKDPRYDVLSRTRNVPGSLSLSSWIAVKAQAEAQPSKTGGTSPLRASRLADALAESCSLAAGNAPEPWLRARTSLVRVRPQCPCSLRHPGWVLWVPAVPRTE